MNAWRKLGLLPQVISASGLGLLIGLMILLIIEKVGLLTDSPGNLFGALLASATVPGIFVIMVVQNSVVQPVNGVSAIVSDMARDGDLRKARHALDALTPDDLQHGNEVHELLNGLGELLRSQELLAEQARAIAKDELWSEVLDNEDSRGDLADAFGLMITMLRALSIRVNRIAQGELVGAAEPRQRLGDLGSAFAGMTEKIKLLLDQLHGANTRIDDSARSLQNASRDQAASATEQAAAITETMATMEELAASSGHIADIAKNVVGLADESLQSAQIGNQAVIDVATGMDDIVLATQQGSQRLLELGEKSRSIGKVADLITGIAEQSKFLALNAAIEAARAGEAGRGFAVVAEEVRNLANHVVESTASIEELIAEIQDLINAAVLASEEGVKRAEDGRELSNRAQECLVSIKAITKRSTDAARQIELATNQQRSASTQVAATVREVASASEEVAGGAKRVTDLSGALATLAVDLREVLSGFETGEPVSDGEGTEEAPAVSVAR